MVKRRSLNDGLTPEEEAFLNHAQIKSAQAPDSKSVSRPERKQTPQRNTQAIKPAMQAAAIAGVVSLNTRISASLGTALLAASMQRKIQRLEPFTQQDIVSEAVEAWLKSNGYL